MAVSNGTASTSTSTLSVGSHQLTAVFTPANPTLYSPSISPPVPFMVSGATAHQHHAECVLNSHPRRRRQHGDARRGGFPDGGRRAPCSSGMEPPILATAVAVANGTASQTTTTLTVGSHQLTAVFTPTDPTLYGPSTSSAVTFVISGATTTGTTLDTAPTSPVVENTPMTMTATITPAAAVGTVQFRDGNTNIGAPVTVNNGTARENATLGVGDTV